MPKLTSAPFEYGLYLEADPGNTSNIERTILWERTLDPMAWHEEVIWLRYGAVSGIVDGFETEFTRDWIDTKETDESMADKLLYKF